MKAHPNIDKGKSISYDCCLLYPDSVKYRNKIDIITNIVYNVAKKERLMTKHEISNIFDIPLTTLYDWEKENHPRHTLYRYLSNTSKSVATKILNKRSAHRILHILNRNITDDYKYTIEEVKKAFSHNAYKLATQREKLIYSKFFKECDEEDLNDLVENLNVSKRDIERIYRDIPERAFSGASKVWDRRFRLSSNAPKVSTHKKVVPTDFAKQYLNKKSVSAII